MLRRTRPATPSPPPLPGAERIGAAQTLVRLREVGERHQEAVRAAVEDPEVIGPRRAAHVKKVLGLGAELDRLLWGAYWYHGLTAEEIIAAVGESVPAAYVREASRWGKL